MPGVHAAKPDPGGAHLLASEPLLADWVIAMATLTVRGVPDETKARLRVRAARHGRSMEAEARTILQDLLSETPVPDGLGSRIHARFAALGGVDLQMPPRTELPRAAEFDS
ncbi:MAG: FitA-like ribbon-helix-helix domain-containing protein [Mycobacteriales bacterium]